MQLIDSHTHLDFAVFDHDRLQVLAGCQALGVKRALVMGISSANWDKLWQLCQQHSMLYAAFGLHPMFLAQHTQQNLIQLETYLQRFSQHNKCVAVGEIGLDYYLAELDKTKQQQLFQAQLELAKQFDLPVCLHVRRAHADTVKYLKQVKLERGGIVHAFSGSLEEAKEYLKLGFYLGIGGAATWEQAKHLHRVFREIPTQHWVLETDAPDMAPSFHAKQRNSPEFLPQICQQLAQLKQISPEQLAQITTNNVQQLFHWSTIE